MPVYPVLPSTDCGAKPAAPAPEASDNDWARWKRARDAWGEGCADKLQAVDQVRKTWPQQATDQVPK